MSGKPPVHPNGDTTKAEKPPQKKVLFRISTSSLPEESSPPHTPTEAEVTSTDHDGEEREVFDEESDTKAGGPPKVKVKKHPR